MERAAPDAHRQLLSIHSSPPPPSPTSSISQPRLLGVGLRVVRTHARARARWRAACQGGLRMKRPWCGCLRIDILFPTQVSHGSHVGHVLHAGMIGGCRVAVCQGDAVGDAIRTYGQNRTPAKACAQTISVDTRRPLTHRGKLSISVHT